MFHEIGTTLKILEEYTHHVNLTERYVGLTKTSIQKDLRKSDAPIVLWDFCADFRMRINNLTARLQLQLQGQNPHLATFGEEGDIYNVCQLNWYKWAYAMDGAAKFSNQSQLF